MHHSVCEAGLQILDIHRILFVFICCVGLNTNTENGSMQHCTLQLLYP